jgi:hypothetical protein
MKNMLSSFPTFQYSIVPVFHGQGIENCLRDDWRVLREEV